MTGYAAATIARPTGVVNTAAAVISTGATIFTVSNGPILITALSSYCVTVNGAGAGQTVIWFADGSATNQVSTALTGTSGDLASFAVGGVIYCNFTALNTAPVITQTAGVHLWGPTTSTGGGVVVPAGVIGITYANGPSTGTFTHHMVYQPLSGLSVVS